MARDMSHVNGCGPAAQGQPPSVLGMTSAALGAFPRVSSPGKGPEQPC